MNPSHDHVFPVSSELQRRYSRVKGKTAMADRVRDFNWRATSLGPMQDWSVARMAVVNLVLASPFSAALLCGRDLIMICNDAYASEAGIGCESALGQPFHHGWPEAWPVLGPQLQAVFKRGDTVLQEDIPIPARAAQPGRSIQTADLAYITYAITPVYELESIAAVHLGLRDTTRAVLAASQLRESEERSTRILQSIGDGVVVTDALGRVTIMNPVAEDLTGWPAEEAHGRALGEVFRIIGEEDRGPIENPVEQAMRSGRTVNLANHAVLVRRDQKETYIDDSAAPIRGEDGKLHGVVLVFRDTNEKRAAEKERERIMHDLHRKFNEMRAIYETTSVALAMIDPVEFRYVRGNPMLAQILNQPIEEVVGSPVFDLANDVAGLREALAIAASGTAVVGKVIEGSLANTPGVHRYWQVDYIPVFSDTGEVEMIVASSAEITSVKRMQQALIQQEKLAVVGRLAASITHEINNPLESVMNLLYLSQTSTHLPEIHQFLQTAEEELRRVSSITNQTLRFYKQSTHPTAVTCEELFSGVVSMYGSRFANSNIVVEKRTRSTKTVLCFEGEIRQVLNNLIGNAIDAMNHGGRLLLRGREGTSWSSGRRGLTITVADTAEGIAPEILKQIFEPFFTTKGTFGTGLGLWVSHGIVERHQGVLRVKSSRKQGSSGTVFTLFLPFNAVTR